VTVTATRDLDPAIMRTLDEVLCEHVCSILDACGQNRTNAARVLGIDRKTLARNLRRWGITSPRQPRTLRPGSLVAIEGLDGSGISTQVAELVKRLGASGHKAIATEEPTTGPIGRLIRDLLGDITSLAPSTVMRTLSLLFAADRLDHFHRVVAPALAAETTVVSDRWYHSSLAYQRTGVEREWILQLNRYTRTPDVTIYLAVSPEVGRERRGKAGRAEELFHGASFQKEVATGYRVTISELRSAGERIEVIDGEPSIDVVADAITAALGL
jgi:dTMP kinase